MSLEEKLIRTKTVYNGKYVQAEERIVRLPDGREAVREIVRPPDAVGVLPIEADGTIHLVRQYRQAIGRVILEIPAGIINPGESKEETGRRECEEETGVRPAKMEWLFRYYHSVGFSTGNIEIYLGTELAKASSLLPDDGEFIERVRMPFDELYRKAVSGEIVDSKTMLAALWYQHRVRKV
ncbi:MAG: NUDIX hydrolase [Nitrospirae bacterium]|nr:NUDIX hydrolase [Nitrospirota bacterium]